MVSLFISFTGLFSAVFCLLMGVGLLGTLLSLRMAMAGFSPLVIGLIMAAYYVGLVAGSLVCRRLVARVGHIRAFAAFAAVTTVTALLHGLNAAPLFWGALRLVTGVATIGLFMVIESWLNECTASDARGRVFSIYMVLSYLGMGAGQLLLNVGDARGLEPFLVAGLCICGCLIPVTVTRSAQPRLPETVRYGFIALFLKSPLGILGCLSAGLINSSLYSLGPVFSSRIGLSTSQTAWFMSAAIFGGLAIQWPVGVLSDRYDRTLFLALLGALVAVGSLVMVWIGSYAVGWIFPGMVFFGGCIFTIYPVSVARAYDVFAGEDIVAVSSALLFGYGIGASAGPVAGAMTMAALGSPYGLFVFCGAVGAAYAAVTLYSRRRKRIEIVPVEEQVGFLPMKSASPVAVQIDPRADAEQDAP